jgi:aminopeptidase YwaD
MRHPLLVVFLLVVFISLSAAQERDELLDSRTRDLFHETLSGELAREHVIAITRHHRIQGSRGYRDAANYVLQQLRSYGFSDQDAYIESFKSDGKVTYQTWQSPSGWDIEWGELRMLEPYEERIVGYPEIAMSVITYSNAGDATAELVWVGGGTRDEDYAGKDVAGKIVLATGYGGAVHRLAVLKYGAKAVVCYLDDARAKHFPDMLQYTGMWPRTDELERVTFGFNLTNRQGTKLRDLLLSGKKVVVRAQVKGRGLEPYFMDVVVAHIRGSEKPEEELVFSAHLDHPKESANDNASGSAAILDIARAMKELIDAGRLQRPKRSFRFIWIPEWYGLMAYIDAHPEMVGPELGGKFLANMNLDMVGENLELLHSKLIITRTPSSLPSVVNDVVENMAQMVDRMEIRTPRGSQSVMNYRMTPYSGGSDHMMFIDRKIPGMMFSHDPDHTHHTSEDTPDKVDPVELERCEMIAASALWYLANLDAAEARNVVYLAGAKSSERLGNTSRRAFQLVHHAEPPVLGERIVEATMIIEQSHREEKSAISSILNFNDDRTVVAAADAMKKQLDQQLSVLKSELTRVSAMRFKGTRPVVPKSRIDSRIPIRLTRGPLDFGLPESRLTQIGQRPSAPYRLGGSVRFEIVNFIDGRRTITDIEHALVGQFGREAIVGFDRFIEDLVKVGVVKWK